MFEFHSLPAINNSTLLNDVRFDVNDQAIVGEQDQKWLQILDLFEQCQASNATLHFNNCTFANVSFTTPGLFFNNCIFSSVDFNLIDANMDKCFIADDCKLNLTDSVISNSSFEKAQITNLQNCTTKRTEFASVKIHLIQQSHFSFVHFDLCEFASILQSDFLSPSFNNIGPIFTRITIQDSNFTNDNWRTSDVSLNNPMQDVSFERLQFNHSSMSGLQINFFLMQDCKFEHFNWNKLNLPSTSMAGNQFLYGNINYGSISLDTMSNTLFEDIRFEGIQIAATHPTAILTATFIRNSFHTGIDNEGYDNFYAHVHDISSSYFEDCSIHHGADWPFTFDAIQNCKFKTLYLEGSLTATQSQMTDVTLAEDGYLNVRRSTLNNMTTFPDSAINFGLDRTRFVAVDSHVTDLKTTGSKATSHCNCNEWFSLHNVTVTNSSLLYGAFEFVKSNIINSTLGGEGLVIKPTDTQFKKVDATALEVLKIDSANRTDLTGIYFDFDKTPTNIVLINFLAYCNLTGVQWRFITTSNSAKSVNIDHCLLDHARLTQYKPDQHHDAVMCAVMIMNDVAYNDVWVNKSDFTNTCVAIAGEPLLTPCNSSRPLLARMGFFPDQETTIHPQRCDLPTILGASIGGTLGFICLVISLLCLTRSILKRKRNGYESIDDTHNIQNATEKLTP